MTALLAFELPLPKGTCSFSRTSRLVASFWDRPSASKTIAPFALQIYQLVNSYPLSSQIFDKGLIPFSVIWMPHAHPSSSPPPPFSSLCMDTVVILDLHATFSPDPTLLFGVEAKYPSV